MASRPLRGYRRLPGTRHRYITPDGSEISEYRYRSLKAQRHGFKNYAQARRQAERQDYKLWRFRALSHDRQADVAAGGSVQAAWAATQRERDRGLPDDRRNRKGGPLDQLLTAAGYRSADWDWAVGETPKGVHA